MPELPEVETIKRTLEPLLMGRSIVRPLILRADVIKHPQAGDFARLLSGRKIAGLGRRGKYLLINLADDYQLAVHLRMTGRLVCCRPQEERIKHTHVILPLDDGQELRFSDVRRFGCLWLLAPAEVDDFSGMPQLGPEPLSADFDAAYLKQALAKRKSSIKQALLDQHLLAGLGNIYVDEALFLASISPLRPANQLSQEELESLAAAIVQVLEQGIKHNGTTFSDYVDGRGNKGANIDHLWAYGRAGQACRRCGQILLKQKVAGRGTVFCPGCQK